jgi:gas vesicle structural protein
MTVASHSANRYLDRPAPSSLADVIDTILDKGLVIDIYVRVSLVGIEILTIDDASSSPVSTRVHGPLVWSV